MGDAPARIDVEDLVRRLREGDRSAEERLLRELYGELRRIAGNLMRRERVEHTLQPTALVGEAYLKLFGSRPANWQGRTHVLAVAARAMRQVLADHARRRGAEKRGGDLARVTLADGDGSSPIPVYDPMELSDALARMEREYRRQSRVVELRYLAGLSVEETATILSVSPRTVKSDTRFALAWLRRALGDEGTGPG